MTRRLTNQLRLNRADVPVVFRTGFTHTDWLDFIGWFLVAAQPRSLIGRAGHFGTKGSYSIERITQRNLEGLE